MARIKVVTDSACDLPTALAERAGIEVVPLTIRFGDDEFDDLSPESFWAKCRASKTLPETAAPSPGAFQRAYEAAHDDGYDGVVVVTLSSLLSATHQSATVAAEAVAGTIEVTVIDTLNVSMGLGLIALELADAAAGGAGLSELATHGASLVQRSGVVATLDTLEHLVKGGRIGGARALLGQVLAIKPLVELKGGVVAEAGRQRTRAKALAAVSAAARAKAPLRRFALFHGACHDVPALEKLVADIESEIPLVVADVGPVVGTHGGPGIIGLCWIER